eukprot:Filipodium_phascolosomae@DN2367_c0_g1_i8.p1
MQLPAIIFQGCRKPSFSYTLTPHLRQHLYFCKAISLKLIHSKSEPRSSFDSSSDSSDEDFISDARPQRPHSKSEPRSSFDSSSDSSDEDFISDARPERPVFRNPKTPQDDWNVNDYRERMDKIVQKVQSSLSKFHFEKIGVPQIADTKIAGDRPSTVVDIANVMTERENIVVNVFMSSLTEKAISAIKMDPKFTGILTKTSPTQIRIQQPKVTKDMKKSLGIKIKSKAAAV